MIALLLVLMIDFRHAGISIVSSEIVESKFSDFKYIYEKDMFRLTVP